MKENSMQHVNQRAKSAKLEKLQSLVHRASLYSSFLAGKLNKPLDDLPHKPKKRKTEDQPDNITGCILRDYQIVGLEWLISLYENGLNGILADEMGLGKTLQTIAFLGHLRSVGTHGPFLIVAPLSTISNWEREFQRFAPSIPILLYHGSPATRKALRARQMKAKPSSADFPVVVTSYEISMNDRRFLAPIPWKYIVVDEGWLINDLKAYTSANRLLLTGTPLQNNLSELWSLLNFLMPQIFNDLEAFEEWFEFENDIEGSLDSSDKSATSSMVTSLHAILDPFLLRRVKTEVMKDLPKKREYLLYAPMVPKQRELYEAVLKKDLKSILERNMSSIYSLPHDGGTVPSEIELDKSVRRRTARYAEADTDDEFEEQVAEVVADSAQKAVSGFIKRVVGSQNLKMMIVQLRKVCNHPYLFHIETETERPLVQGIPEVVAWSGKMLLLDRLLTALLKKDHKVLIFSQMTGMLNIIEDWLHFEKKLRFCRIDGDVKLSERHEQILDFNRDPEVKVFMLSTRAGGLGINLTAADTVIIFDSDWNPQVDLQAQDRVHRIGQKKPVIVYRFLTSDSIEKKILERAKAKRTLEKEPEYDGLNLQEILSEEVLAIETAANLGSDTEIPGPLDILSEQDLEKIMDRSEKAYSAASLGHLDAPGSKHAFDIVPEETQSTKLF
ncbi:hypothetical protein HDU91_000764 [Kappamyces sp. JEL0680]|nr:hypothetical protein HDU91_000764 [Kappamyces sp. JEL0680]